MGDEVRLTKGMTKASETTKTDGGSYTATVVQDLRDVLDVMAYERGQFQLRVYAVSGTDLTEVKVSLETSMQNELSDDAYWDTAFVSFGTFTTANLSKFVATVPIVSTVVQPDRLLRYLRWKVKFTTSTNNQDVALTFEITGVGRPG